MSKVQKRGDGFHRPGPYRVNIMLGLKGFIRIAYNYIITTILKRKKFPKISLIKRTKSAQILQYSTFLGIPNFLINFFFWPYLQKQKWILFVLILLQVLIFVNKQVQTGKTGK